MVNNDTDRDAFSETLCCFKNYSDVESPNNVAHATGSLGNIRFLLEDILYGDEVIENVKILYTSCPNIVLECMFSDEIDNVLDEYKQIHDNLIGNMAFMYTGSLGEIKRLFEDHSLEYNTSNIEQFENERNDIKINNPFTMSLDINPITMKEGKKYSDIPNPGNYSQANGPMLNIKRFLESDVILKDDIEILYTSCICFVFESLFSPGNDKDDHALQNMNGNLKFNYNGSDDDFKDLFEEFGLEFQGEIYDPRVNVSNDLKQCKWCDNMSD